MYMYHRYTVCVLILAELIFLEDSSEASALIHEYSNMFDNNELLYL